MKAVICTSPDPAFKTLSIQDCALPQPGPGQIRVRLRAASLNPVDHKLASGFLPWWQGVGPRIVGLDGAGVVDAIGPDVTGWQLGERVVWHGDLGRDGVLAEYALADAHVVARIPEGVSFEVAAALPCAGLTAYQALVRKARVGQGDVVLVQGASGAVGGFGLQIARYSGATVIALARPAEQARVKALGADHVFSRTDPALRDKIRALTGGYGVDIMLEVARAKDARQSLDLIRYNGHLLCIHPLLNMTQVSPYTYAVSVHEVALGGAYAAGHLPTQVDFALMAQELMALVAQGKVDPLISSIVPFAEAPAALQQMQADPPAGKIVVTFEQGAQV